MGVNTTELISEIRSWRIATELFVRTYEIQRHFATQWSVVNTLLKHPEGAPIPMRNLLKAVPASAQKRSSKSHDVSACVDDLRKADFVKVQDGGRDTQLDRSSFPVSVGIVLQPKLIRAANRYVRGLLQELYGGDFCAKYAERWPVVLGAIFEFSMYNFSKVWSRVIADLVRGSIADSDRRQEFINEVVGSTEYFALLLSLWEANLAEHDEDGYRLATLIGLPRSITGTNDEVVTRCVKRLLQHRILVPVKDDPQTISEPVRDTSKGDRGYYRLGRDQISSLKRHASDFIELRANLQETIEQQIEAEQQRSHRTE